MLNFLDFHSTLGALQDYLNYGLQIFLNICQVFFSRKQKFRTKKVVLLCNRNPIKLQQYIGYGEDEAW